MQLLLFLCALPLPGIPGDTVLHDVSAPGTAQVLLVSLH